MRLLLVLVVLVLVVAVFLRATLFSSLPSRRARWRIRFRFKPAPGFASFGELAFRWSRLAAVVHGRRVRPDLGFWARMVCPVTWYAWRLGRAQYFKRVFAPQEHQTAIIAPPRVGKSGFLGEWMLSHRGACVSFTTRADLYELTAGTRAQLGPVHVFNPYGVGGIPSHVPAGHHRRVPVPRGRGPPGRRPDRGDLDDGRDGVLVR